MTGTPVPFIARLAEHGFAPLVRGDVQTIQINLGRLCNQACRHCHVEAGPTRPEVMTEATAERVLALLAATPDARVIDLTGGAPELNPSFRRLVDGGRALGRTVIDRCNLTVVFEPGMEDLAAFLAERGVHVIASLPCYRQENVERQRGPGVFERSIQALRALNALGYGREGSSLRLDLVHNPSGPALPAPEQTLEAQYKQELRAAFGIEFNALLTLTNMPIGRFAADLRRRGAYGAYLESLSDHFNPATVPRLMCRSLISVGWDGRLFDCDFNQMLGIPLASAAPGEGAARTIWDISSFAGCAGREIATAQHCFGCTAGAGSSCGGTLA